MILAAVLIFTPLILGTESFKLPDFGSELRQETVQKYEELIAPLKEVEDQIVEVEDTLSRFYDKAETVILTKGFLDLSKEDFLSDSDDCLKLTNTSEIAYGLAVNVTNFALTAVEELATSLNTLIECSNVSILDQLPCVFEKLKVVKEEVQTLQAEFVPYQKESKDVFQQLISQLHACL